MLHQVVQSLLHCGARTEYFFLGILRIPAPLAEDPHDFLLDNRDWRLQVLPCGHRRHPVALALGARSGLLGCRGLKQTLGQTLQLLFQPAGVRLHALNLGDQFPEPGLQNAGIGDVINALQGCEMVLGLEVINFFRYRFALLLLWRGDFRYCFAFAFAFNFMGANDIFGFIASQHLGSRDQLHASFACSARIHVDGHGATTTRSCGIQVTCYAHFDPPRMCPHFLDGDPLLRIDG
mmetsp:Transcript_103149/g.177816  ORF Transcript_103149/g.177816 Transcript_103149/m.177816 type:complete len:235 (+) Transcript_103149:790-1494(+)